MALEHITTKQQLDQYLDKETVILFKHSSTCPVSAEAFNEYQMFVNEHSEIPAVFLVVQENRDLSNEVAESFHVKHQSPQVILFRNGNVAWHESHWRITNESLTTAIMEE